MDKQVKGRIRLSGQTAIVTGASSGIGAGIAETLGAAGANVVVNYAGHREGSSERLYPEFILRIPGGEIGSLNILTLRSSDESNGW